METVREIVQERLRFRSVVSKPPVKQSLDGRVPAVLFGGDVGGGPVEVEFAANRPISPVH